MTIDLFSSSFFQKSRTNDLRYAKINEDRWSIAILEQNHHPPSRIKARKKREEEEEEENKATFPRKTSLLVWPRFLGRGETRARVGRPEEPLWRLKGWRRQACESQLISIDLMIARGGRLGGAAHGDTVATYAPFNPSRRPRRRRRDAFQTRVRVHVSPFNVSPPRKKRERFEKFASFVPRVPLSLEIEGRPSSYVTGEEGGEQVRREHASSAACCAQLFEHGVRIFFPGWRILRSASHRGDKWQGTREWKVKIEVSSWWQQL